MYVQYVGLLLDDRPPRLRLVSASALISIGIIGILGLSRAKPRSSGKLRRDPTAPCLPCLSLCKDRWGSGEPESEPEGELEGPDSSSGVGRCASGPEFQFGARARLGGTGSPRAVSPHDARPFSFPWLLRDRIEC